jgi:hypothetical protein
MTENDDWHYWSLDLPGLTETQAVNLLGVVKGKGLAEASIVDPRKFLTLHLDRVTVECLRDALKVVSNISGLPSGTNRVCAGMMEDFGEWLEKTDNLPMG